MDGQRSIVKDLSDLLNISTDSVYRRLRGDNEFTLSEIAVIAQTYGISVDSIIYENHVASPFHFNTLYEDRTSLQRYIEGITRQMESLARVGGSLTFIASELPISQSFRHKGLRDFKVYYWQKVILNQSWMRKQKFGEHFSLGFEVNQYIDKLMRAYGQIETVEIWTEETIDDTLRQIDYARESGLFENEAAYNSVVSSLLTCLNQLEDELEDQEEGHPGRLHFYVSSIELGNNIVLMDFNDRKQAYVKFNTFNTVSTDNELFCREIEAMIRNTKSKCIEISGKSDIVRHKFFKTLREKVEALRYVEA